MNYYLIDETGVITKITGETIEEINDNADNLSSDVKDIFLSEKEAKRVSKSLNTLFGKD